MFTGTIEDTARVISAKTGAGMRCVRIQTPRRWHIADGQSIAIDGICSTVAQHGRGFFEVEYMPETLAKTTAESFGKGTRVNLERSLVLGARIDGHFVQGHVDTRATVAAVRSNAGTHALTITLLRPLMRFVALHGSVTINGVALTVSSRGDSTCTVSLIPHTLKRTNLGSLKKGDRVNVEVDMIARYLATLLKK